MLILLPPSESKTPPATGAPAALDSLSFPGLTDAREELVTALAASVAENVGYRQLTAWWRCEGLLAGLRGTRHEWGTMTRTGFEDAAPGGPA